MRRLPNCCVRKFGAVRADAVYCHDVRERLPSPYKRMLIHNRYRYVGALPLALGVRSTNVYEDRSIAIYEDKLDDDDEDAVIRLHRGTSKVKVWGEYMVSPIRTNIVGYANQVPRTGTSGSNSLSTYG